MSDSEDDFVPRSGSGGASDAALAAATSASREKADAYLDKHAALIDLQMQQVRLQNENLRQQDEYELSHLRWRRFNDQMAGAAQIEAAIRSRDLSHKGREDRQAHYVERTIKKAFESARTQSRGR